MFNANELSFFLLDNVIEGIMILSEELSIVYSNAKAEEYLGLKHIEIMDKPCSIILDGVFTKEGSPLLKAIASGKIAKDVLNVRDNKLTISAYTFKGKPGEKAYKILLILPEAGLAEASNTNLIAEKTEVNALQFASNVLEAIADLSEAKNISVASIVDEAVETIFINEKQMSFALVNLLSKAINFSVKGKLILHLKERETGNSNLLCIENPEETIKESDFTNTINSFNKGTDKAKNIVEAHGGKLWIETEKGFSIIFSIPKNLL